MKLHPLLISFSSIPLHNISSLSSVPGPSDPHRWSFSFTRSFRLVSKSLFALSATKHPISGTDFLYYLDYLVLPRHPPVVFHSENLLLACYIRCSILVSKVIFFSTSWIINHSRCWIAFERVILVQCRKFSSPC